jgi:predicted DNA-binding transcriptional regulator AlpA
MRQSPQTSQKLQAFSSLPPEAHIRVGVVAALYGCSVPTAWRWARAGRIPSPRKFSTHVTAWNVGELRAALAKAVTP